MVWLSLAGSGAREPQHAVRTRRVAPAEAASVDPDLLTLRNLNTPDDYRDALARAGFN